MNQPESSEPRCLLVSNAKASCAIAPLLENSIKVEMFYMPVALPRRFMLARLPSGFSRQQPWSSLLGGGAVSVEAVQFRLIVDLKGSITENPSRVL